MLFSLSSYHNPFETLSFLHKEGYVVLTLRRNLGYLRVSLQTGREPTFRILLNLRL